MAIKPEVRSLKERYVRWISDKGTIFHYNRPGDEQYKIVYPLFWDTRFRDLIGKTDDINVSLCSHDAIISRELPEHFCRVCHTNLAKVGIGRVNDYLVIRHPQCRQPICLDCSKNRPDAFYKAFEEGVIKHQALSAAERIIGNLNDMVTLIEQKERKKIERKERKKCQKKDLM
jgi:hypothetical protein